MGSPRLWRTSNSSKQPQIEISRGLYSYTLHNIHLEMKCLRILYLCHSGIRELPSSIKYLTGLHDLGIFKMTSINYNFLASYLFPLPDWDRYSIIWMTFPNTGFLCWISWISGAIKIYLNNIFWGNPSTSPYWNL